MGTRVSLKFGAMLYWLLRSMAGLQAITQEVMQQIAEMLPAEQRGIYG